jgi:hypothetical protein
MQTASLSGFGPNMSFKEEVIWFIERLSQLIANVQKKIQAGKGTLQQLDLLQRMRTRLQQLEELRDKIDE